jgi:hypothetical protein
MAWSIRGASTEVILLQSKALQDGIAFVKMLGKCIHEISRTTRPQHLPEPRK